MSFPRLNLTIVDGTLAVCRLEADARSLPGQPFGGSGSLHEPRRSL